MLRVLTKTALFALAAVLVLYPRVDLAVRQAGHFANWEQLIDPALPAMPEINREIDARLPPDAAADPAREVQVVQRYVYDKIPYRYDWYNWGNLDYWPTAAEVWERKSEDCDGRAILAVSILRARGFTTAGITGNLNHVWVKIGANDPRMPRPTALMNPQKTENYRREGDRVIWSPPDLDTVLMTLSQAATFPAWRTGLLVFIALALVFHPCRDWRRMLPCLGLAAGGLWLFTDWAARDLLPYAESSPWQLLPALAFLAAAFVRASRADRVPAPAGRNPGKGTEA